MYLFFFFNDTATTEIYTYLHPLSLHEALPISANSRFASACRNSSSISLRDSRFRSKSSLNQVQRIRPPRLDAYMATSERRRSSDDASVSPCAKIGRAHV